MKAMWLEDEEPIDAALLESEGIPCGWHDPSPEAFQPLLDELKRTRGYVEQDEVALSPATPDLDALCAKFSDEHTHDDDEVRFVLAGAGIFDIRSRDDRWMRVVVTPGDLIVVPAERDHRFMLTEEKTIRCVRLFKDSSGWVPRYRKDREAPPPA